MANFIKLTSNNSERPVLINADAIAWVSTKEVAREQHVTVIHFTAAYAADALSLTVKEDYDTVIETITS